MEKAFTREDTKAMKGIAVIMLLVIHLWPFGDRHPAGFEWIVPFGLFDARWIEIVGWSSQMTMYVFMFLGGYGLYHQIKKGLKLHEVLIRIYRNFWRVFVIMIPIAFLFFSKQPTDFLVDSTLCTRYADFSFRDLAINFLGIDFTFNSEWWFITAYAAATVTGYLLILATDRNRSFWADAAIVIAIGIMFNMLWLMSGDHAALRVVSDSFMFSKLINNNSVPFYMGIVFAKHNGLARLRAVLEQYSVPARAIISLVGLLLIFAVRQTEMATYDLDVVIVPFFVVLCMTLVDLVPFVKRALGYLGRHCNNIWLIHSFYCYYFYAATKVVYFTKDPFISLLTLLAMSLASSIAIERFYALLGKLPAKLKKTPVNA